VQPVLGRRDDAGLVLAAERVRRLGGGGRPGRRPVAGATDREGADHPGGGRTAAEEAAPGDAPALRVALLAHRFVVPSARQESTAAVSWDSGSDSALTASDSCLTSSGVSWS